MTVARQLKREGKIEGKREGKIEGIQTRSIQIARNMLLKLHLDIDTVQEATELSKAELEKILQGNS